MRLEEKNLQTLHTLGLTPPQAKIYLASIQAGKESIQIISTIANIDRSNTYQVMSQLQKMGLIIRILGTPIRYEAIPFADAITLLLKFKEDQFIEIQKEAQEAIRLKQTNYATQDRKDYEFKMINHDRDAQIVWIINVCESARESFDLLLNRKTFCGGVIDLAKYQLDCIKRGVKYRVVTERIDSPSIKNKLQAFVAHPNFRIRYLREFPSTQITIQDKKFASIMLLPNSGIVERPSLLTNHKGCVEIFQRYFDDMWNQAQEII